MLKLKAYIRANTNIFFKKPHDNKHYLEIEIKFVPLPKRRK